MSFSEQIASFGVNASRRVQDIRRGVTLKLFNAVILDTPVDEGTLRGNWQVTIGAPAEGILDRDDKSGRAPMAEAEKAAKDSDGDTPVFLTNNLPYGPKVEFEGHSHTKAPEGMVRKNVARFGRLIKIEVSAKK